MAVTEDLSLAARHYAGELEAAIDDRWFGPWVKPTFVAAGRLDGKAAVLLNSGGWRMVHHVEGEPVVETFRSAAEAKAAADAVVAA